MTGTAVGRQGPGDTLARLLRDEPCQDAFLKDAETLAERAAAEGVDALLAARFRQRPEVPEPIRRRFADLEAAAVVLAALKDLELRRVLDHLHAAGIDVLVVKGAALAQTDYPAPHLRPRVDTDLLVRRHDLDRLQEALDAAGYRASVRASTGELVSHQRAFERQDQRGMCHVLDVHWRLANPQVFAAALDEPALFETAVDVPGLGPWAKTPALPESLLLCTIHRLAHHQDRERLIWLHDIDLLARRASSDAWERLVALATACRMCAVCLDGLDRARDVLGTPVPKPVRARLAGMGGTEPSAAWVGARQPRLRVLRADLRELPTWRDRVRLLREHAFPPGEFVMTRYRATSRAWLPALYLLRLTTGLWKWLIER